MKSLEWDEDGLKASLVSAKAQTINIEAFGKTKKVKLKAKQTTEIVF